MERTELEKAILDILQEIERIKSEIDVSRDAARIGLLTRRKKELQYLQLWQMEQLALLPDDDECSGS
jgi:hypothetical protein